LPRGAAIPGAGGDRLRLLDGGEHLLDDEALRDYRVVETAASDAASHSRLVESGSARSA
jgi:hypothetical protein